MIVNLPEGIDFVVRLVVCGDRGTRLQLLLLGVSTQDWECLSKGRIHPRFTLLFNIAMEAMAHL